MIRRVRPDWGEEKKEKKKESSIGIDKNAADAQSCYRNAGGSVMFQETAKEQGVVEIECL